MEQFFKTFSETQKNSLEAAASFADSWLVVTERMTQLNIEVARTTFEKSSDMVLFCLESALPKMK